MPLKIYRPEGRPCIFTDGLVAGTLVPCHFGRHTCLLCTGAGEVATRRRIVLSLKCLGSRSRARKLYWLLEECRYSRIEIYDSVEIIGNQEFGERNGWKTVGKRMESV